MSHLHTEPNQFDFTVSGFLVHDSKTLLIKHKYLPIWTPPAGHIELNETPIEALYKEIEEEAGIHSNHLTLIETSPESRQIEKDDDNRYIPLPFDMDYHNITDDHRHINLAYLLQSTTNHVEPKDGESNTFKWFTIEELEEFRETRPNIINQAIFAIQYIGKNKS
ncbi:nucleoside triphosphate pyrophosphohydrolase [compost metagenome]